MLLSKAEDIRTMADSVHTDADRFINGFSGNKIATVIVAIDAKIKLAAYAGEYRTEYELDYKDISEDGISDHDQFIIDNVLAALNEKGYKAKCQLSYQLRFIIMW